jgi:hypothetical protein
MGVLFFKGLGCGNVKNGRLQYHYTHNFLQALLLKQGSFPVQQQCVFLHCIDPKTTSNSFHAKDMKQRNPTWVHRHSQKEWLCL